METKQKRTKVVVSVLALAALVLFSLSGYAGKLEPGGPPQPTMKTLDEVEPRIPISQADIPLTISTPGSYYLTEDVTAAGTAITVAVDDVTIDLSGFALVGPDSGTNCGIYMSGRSNVEIRNGTVRDFYTGIYEGGSLGQDHRVIDVRFVSNGLRGIFLTGKSHLVKDCTASDNGHSATSTVYGIWASNGSTVTGNTVYFNGYLATGSYVYGIAAGNGSTVTGNTASDNGNSAGGTVYGIYVRSGSTVTANTTRNNADYGIYASIYCLVDQNTATDNGTNMYTGTGCVLGNNCAP